MKPEKLFAGRTGVEVHEHSDLPRATADLTPEEEKLSKPGKDDNPEIKALIRKSVEEILGCSTCGLHTIDCDKTLKTKVCHRQNNGDDWAVAYYPSILNTCKQHKN